jgi:hypothetical protein
MITAAAPDSLKQAADVAFMAQVSEADLRRILPFRLTPLESFTEPEPSEGSSVRLPSGRFVVAIYGSVTHTLSIYASLDADGVAAAAEFLHEAKLDRDAIQWVRPEFAGILQMKPLTATYG